jgi:hypothetical protein
MNSYQDAKRAQKGVVRVIRSRTYVSPPEKELRHISIIIMAEFTANVHDGHGPVQTISLRDHQRRMALVV